MTKRNTKEYLKSYISLDHSDLIVGSTRIVAEADGQNWEYLPNELKAEYAGIAGMVIEFFVNYVGAVESAEENSDA